jgi:hypothetical protein
MKINLASVLVDDGRGRASASTPPATTKVSSMSVCDIETTLVPPGPVEPALPSRR